MASPKPDKVNIKKIGRNRRATGWTLLLLGLLVAGVWVASGWVAVWYSRGTVRLAVKNGELRIRQGWPLPPPPGAGRWVVERSSVDGDWTCWYGWSTRTHALGRAGAYGVLRTDTSEYLGRHTILAFWFVPPLLWLCAVLLLRSGIAARERGGGGLEGAQRAAP